MSDGDEGTHNRHFTSSLIEGGVEPQELPPLLEERVPLVVEPAAAVARGLRVAYAPVLREQFVHLRLVGAVGVRARVEARAVRERVVRAVLEEHVREPHLARAMACALVEARQSRSKSSSVSITSPGSSSSTAAEVRSTTSVSSTALDALTLSNCFANSIELWSARRGSGARCAFCDFCSVVAKLDDDPPIYKGARRVARVGAQRVLVGNQRRLPASKADGFKAVLHRAGTRQVPPLGEELGVFAIPDVSYGRHRSSLPARAHHDRVASGVGFGCVPGGAS